MLPCAGGLHAAPDVDRAPALIDDAAHEVVHEVEFGAHHRQVVLVLDREQRREFLAGEFRRQLLVASSPEEALELLDEAAEAATQGMVW